MPAPPASVKSAKSRRTSVGSTSSSRAMPAATPATTPWARSRAGIEVRSAMRYGSRTTFRSPRPTCALIRSIASVEPLSRARTRASQPSLLLPNTVTSHADRRDCDRQRGERDADEHESAGAALVERADRHGEADPDRADRERDVPRDVDTDGGQQREGSGCREQYAEDGEEDRRLPGRADLRARLGRRLAVARAALRDHDREPAEQEQRPGEAAVRPEVGLRDDRDGRDPDERDAGEQPGPVTVPPERLGDDRVPLALIGDDERRGDIEQDPGPADERQHGEGDPEERRGEVEVAPEAAGDAREDAVVSAAVKLLDGLGGGIGGGHLCLSWGTIPGCAPPR